MPLKLIVGLGNPGVDYAATRHNAGAWFVEQLAARCAVTLQAERKFHGLVARALVAEHDCRLLVPTTYMNNSGQAVAAISNFYKIDPGEILIAHDELDFSAGVVKLKNGGGHGGHNGLHDIFNHKGKQFSRLRIGIGKPTNSKQTADYVLKRPSKSEQALIDDALAEVLALMPLIMSGDIANAMKELHTKPLKQ
ncbi:MAG: aminoacyl-tRNA hydrolase [Gammaproteobacteria bacterium]|nr:aminoacyl-tRNA hydrolase [Gammaproteobacteria bacterium]